MTEERIITAEAVSQALQYDPNTGEQVWLVRPISHFQSKRAMNAWNARYPGTKAGKRDREGRLVIFFMGKPYLSYRLAFLQMTGEWPAGEVDHINGNPSDDRWDNLRVASHQQNSFNQKRKKNNTTGFKGVYPSKVEGKYISSIRIGDKRKVLGTFDTAEEAHAAYCKAAADLHGEFARTK